MEVFSIFRSYLEILRDHYSDVNSGRSSQGKLVKIQDFGNYLIIAVRLVNKKIKFQSSERVQINNIDGIVEHYQNGNYYFRIRPDSGIKEDTEVIVNSTSDLVFLVDNMLTNLNLIKDSKEYSELISNLYSKKETGWEINKLTKTAGDRFTESQNEVIFTTLKLLESEKGIIPVEGPGGSGKTECIAEICKQAIKLKKRVLVCSATNLAIDNVLTKLCDEKDVLRIGADTSITLQNVKKFSIRNKLRENSDYDDLISSSKIIGATIDSTGIYLKNEDFDLVVIDEASTVEFPRLLIALLKSKRAVICGDTQQLSSFIDQKVLEKLRGVLDKEEIALLHESPFKLISKNWKDNTLYLRDNFRNSKKVFEFINKQFYEGRMLFKSNSKFEKQKAKSLGSIAESDEITWIVPHGSDLELDNRGIFEPVKITKGFRNSYFNHGNLIIIISMLRKLLKNYSPKEIGIISPFNAQVALIREFIIRFPEYVLGKKYRDELDKTKLGFYLLNNLNINTINKFQGQERDAIIFDFTSNADFLFNDTKKLNVVLGRSKKQIILIGLPPRNPIYQDLFEASTTYGDIDFADYSLAFTLNKDDFEEFNKIKELIKSIKDSDFSPRNLEEHLQKEIIHQFLDKYKKDILELNITKKIQQIVSETLRECFSLNSIDEKTYDQVEYDIDSKIKELIILKKKGPLFGY
jgi:superfamily I DNA and/or RNA helicase